MTIGRTAVVLMTVVGLSGCSTMEQARARIVRAPARCVDQTVQIYFEADSAEVTKESKAVITAAARGLKSCRVAGVDVLGLADATGDPQANLELSKRRAQSVSQALAVAGLPAAEFMVSAAGQAGAVTKDGQAPLRRRTDVVLHLAPL